MVFHVVFASKENTLCALLMCCLRIICVWAVLLLLPIPVMFKQIISNDLCILLRNWCFEVDDHLVDLASPECFGLSALIDDIAERVTHEAVCLYNIETFAHFDGEGYIRYFDLLFDLCHHGGEGDQCG